jgi:uncharacterized protein YecE (DUF72 family)
MVKQLLKIEFSIKVQEKITHKKLDINKDVMPDFKEFHDIVSPLYDSGKLGAILIQLSPSFSIGYFRKIFRKYTKKTRKKWS